MNPQTCEKTVHVIPGNAQYIGMRTEQQDAFAFSDVLDETVLSQQGALAVVADGMGGMRNGREASTIAVKTFLSDYCTRCVNNQIEEALDHAIRQANAAVYGLAAECGVVSQMGTTLVAAAVYGGALYWASAGDSRLYVYRDNFLIQQTQDHVYGTLLEEQTACGLITREDADKNEEKHALFSFLGMSGIERIDKNKVPIKLHAHDKILLCSDGLYNTLSYDEIADCLNGAPQQAADLLIERVKAKNLHHQDNMTALILEIY